MPFEIKVVIVVDVELPAAVAVVTVVPAVSKICTS